MVRKSWRFFMREMKKQLNLDLKVNPIAMEEEPQDNWFGHHQNIKIMQDLRPRLAEDREI